MSGRDDTKPRSLTFGERMLLKLMNSGNRAQLGFNHPFLESVVRASGFRGTIAFMRDVGGTVAELEKHYGLLVANLIMAFAGLWNGCPYCSVGHFYAANLLFFKSTGRLYPIAESDVPELQVMTYDQSMERTRQLLSSEELAEHFRIIERLFQLYTAAEIKTEEDRLLTAALASWGWLNECSVPITYDMQVQEIPAILDKKERELVVNRYRAARDAQSRRFAGEKGAEKK